MMKAVWSGAIAAAALLVVSTSAYAQATVSGTVNVNANVAARARLAFSSNAITFADADPVATPVMTATALTIDVRARTSNAANVTLTVLASGDLVSGSDSIGIGNLTWVAGGAGFQPGSSNSTTAQTVGSWTGSGSPSGTQTYSLPNSWAYNTGNYAVSLVYTLTAP